MTERGEGTIGHAGVEPTQMSKDRSVSEWGSAHDELERRREVARAMGGEERLARRAQSGPTGRLDARRRIESLCDPGSFVEMGTLAGSGEDAPADAFIAGHATVAGRPVLVGAEDATVLGGSIGRAGAAKRERLARLAGQVGVPLVMLLDGAGHRATNALVRHTPAPTDLAAMAELSGRVPVVTAVLGASAGHGALAAALADVVVMVEGSSQLFAAGPPIVKVATGEDIDKESLGGARVHAASGVAHLVAADDEHALAMVRSVLGLLPSNADTAAPEETSRSPVRDVADVVPVDMRRPYDGRLAVEAIVDADSVVELQRDHGRSLITCLARLDGVAVAVLASQPLSLAGSIDAESAEKAARFIEWTGSFHLPLVVLADTPGVLPGSTSEAAGVLRAAARLYAAQHRTTVPKMHVTLRKAIGFGSSVMAQNPFDHQIVTLALPVNTVGAMPAQGASLASGAGAETAEALSASEASGPWRLADTLSYDEVVAPAEVRPRLVAALRLALAGRAPLAPVRRIGHLP
jgi:methylmalonyl-CoA decarboxylase subunit alpha